MLKAKVFLESIPTVFNLPAPSTIRVCYLEDLQPREWDFQPSFLESLVCSASALHFSRKVGGGPVRRARQRPGHWHLLWLSSGQLRSGLQRGVMAPDAMQVGLGWCLWFAMEAKGQMLPLKLFQSLRIGGNQSCVFSLFSGKHLPWLAGRSISVPAAISFACTP